MDNIEFIENEAVPIEVRIKSRIEELKSMKEKAIEQLKMQQQLVLNPIDSAIAELTDLLPKEGG
jgi:hypothetical protein